jgi:hypothetical protein
MSTLIGSPQILCRTRRGNNRQSGPYLEYQYEGDRESIYGLKGELDAAPPNAAADNWELDHEGAKYTLKVRYSSTQDDNVEAPVDEFRLHANRLTVSIYNHPTFASIHRGIVQTIRRQMQKPRDDFNPARTSYNFATAPYVPSEIEVANAVELYTVLTEGVDHFVVNQPVIVRARTASSTYSYAGTSSAYQNIGRIISPSSIIGDAALADIVKTVLPSDASGGRYIYGWLKHYPEYTDAAGNKAVLTQEYEYNRWTLSVYGALI